MKEGLIVVAHAARIVVDDGLQLRAAILDLQQLVHLLLVLGDGKARLGMVHDELKLLGHRILIHGHGDAAERLHRAHGAVEPRAVVADDGELIPSLKSESGETACQLAHFFGELTPGPGLPDAEFLFPRGVLVAVAAGILKQKLGEGVEPGIELRLAASPRRGLARIVHFFHSVVSRLSGLLGFSRRAEKRAKRQAGGDLRAYILAALEPTSNG